MKIEFEWNDLVDLVDEASSDDINRIAHAISDIINVVNSNDGGNVDLSDYYTKEDIDNMDLANKGWVASRISLLSDIYYNKSIIDEMFGDVNSALDELHNYAQSLIGGDAS